MREERKQRLASEINWHESITPRTGRLAAALNRVLQSRIFFHPARHWYAYKLLDERLFQVLSSTKTTLPNGPILDLPAGEGSEFALLEQIGDKIVAAEISFRSLVRARQRSIRPMGVCCDALELPFADDSFAMVLINRFLHHTIDEGFDDYLKECLRVLRPGGGIVIQEPSILFPLTWATLSVRWILKILLGHEPFGHVPHERPFNPSSLIQSLHRVGFDQVETVGSSFVHNRFYVPLGTIVARLQGSFLHVPILKHFAWFIIFTSKKPFDSSVR